MANEQNLTVRLPRAVIDQARVLAAQRGTSISALVAQTIAALAEEGAAYQAAQRLAFRQMEDAPLQGDGPWLSREQLHER